MKEGDHPRLGECLGKPHGLRLLVYCLSTE